MNYQGIEFARRITENTYSQLNPILHREDEPTIVFGPFCSYGSNGNGEKAWIRANKDFTDKVNAATARWVDSLPKKGAARVDASPVLEIMDLLMNDTFYGRNKSGVYMPSVDAIGLAPSLAVPFIPHIAHLGVIRPQELQPMASHYTRVAAHELIHWAMAQAIPFAEMRAGANKNPYLRDFGERSLEDVIPVAEKNPDVFQGKGPIMSKMGELGIVHFLEHAGHYLEMNLFPTGKGINVETRADHAMYRLLQSLLADGGIDGYVPTCVDVINRAWQREIPLHFPDL